jgi:putative phage-type endonuclease
VSVTPIRPPVTLGGSDAAAACGIDPYRSRRMLWAEKMGWVERGESEAMTWGKRLEALVIDALPEYGYSDIRRTDLERHDKRTPWRVGHPDGWCTDPASGERMLLEVKTAGAWAGNAWNHEAVPVHYQAQVQHYLYLTGCERALVACLVAGQRLELRELERNDAAIETILALEDETYDYITREVPPPPDGSESSKDAIAAMYPKATAGKVARLTGETWDALRELRAREAQLDVIERQRDELKQLVQDAMGDAEVAISPHDEEVAKWSNVTSTRLDTARIRKERPDLYDTYGVTSEARRFTTS